MKRKVLGGGGGGGEREEGNEKKMLGRVYGRKGDSAQFLFKIFKMVFAFPKPPSQNHRPQPPPHNGK